MIKSEIIGVSYYLPNNVVLNLDLESKIDTSDNWIKERTGIEDRRWVKSGSKLTTSLMGTYLARGALLNKKLKKGDLLCLAAFGSGFTWASALIKW